MKKVGVLGGTFNPPHIGHLIMANEAYHQMNLDEIWFMPNNIPPHKKQDDSISNKDRIEMLNLVCENVPYFHVQLFEIERGEISYTVDTFREFKKMYKDVEFYFIIGGDMIEYLPKFKGIDELANMIQFIGFTREGYEVESTYPIHLVHMPTIAISSSLIRNRVENGQTVKYMISDEVESYIKEQKLYES